MIPSKLKVAKTGIEGLDTILGGGIPTGSLLIIAGAPGTGKTILIQQLCYAWAERQRQEATAKTTEPQTSPFVELPAETETNGARKKATRKERGSKIKRAVYFSTLSEPHDKLLEHISAFEFYNPELIVDYIKLLSLTSVMDQGLDKVADLIVSTVRQESVGFVAIDGFQALEGLVQSTDDVRRFLYRLSAQLNLLGATLVIALERSLQGSASEGDLTVADGIIGLYSRINGVREYHRMEIRKMRGMPRLTGLHAYNIGNGGITFYPRLETLAAPQLGIVGSGLLDRRLSTGIAELDQMMGGGIPVRSSTLVAGSPGVGKSLLGLGYLMDGVKQGQKGLYLGFHESLEQLTTKAAQFGFDLSGAVERGDIVMLSRTPFEIEPDQISTMIREQIEQGDIQRFVLDDLVELDRATQFENRTHDYIAALITYLKTKGVTTLCNFVVNKLTGTELDLSTTPIALLAENLLLLRKVEYKGSFYRTLSVIQMRDSEHQNNSREYKIERETGISILAAQEDGLIDSLAGSSQLQ